MIEMILEIEQTCFYLSHAIISCYGKIIVSKHFIHLKIIINDPILPTFKTFLGIHSTTNVVVVGVNSVNRPLFRPNWTINTD
jgi:hypothetical protein